jgi:transposase
MRGVDDQGGELFSYVVPEARVRADHPLRAVRQLTDAVFAELSSHFDMLYAEIGRPSIPPEQLLRALLVQTLYSIRSERLLMEEIDYSILFRWFVGLSLDAPIWSHTTFTKNRDRLLAGDVAAAFFDAVVGQARAAGLLSDEHFTVDGTQLEAWASLKSFKRRGAAEKPPDDPGNPTVNFRGETRSNATHASTTDPDAQLYKKATGQKSVLSYLGHVLMENRCGLLVNACATAATGTAEREAATIMLPAGRRRRTLGGDKGYDVAAFVDTVRQAQFTPHLAHKQQYSALDHRTTRHPGYDVSQRKRKLVEQAFGWMKTVGLLRKLRHRGGELVDWIFTFTAAAYNIVRLRRLIPVSAA